MKRVKELLHLTFDEMEWSFINGGVTPDQLRQYKVLWAWSTYRYGSPSVSKFHMKHGFDAVVRRINRVRKVLGFNPYIQKEIS